MTFQTRIASLDKENKRGMKIERSTSTEIGSGDMRREVRPRKLLESNPPGPSARAYVSHALRFPPFGSLTSSSQHHDLLTPSRT